MYAVVRRFADAIKTFYRAVPKRAAPKIAEMISVMDFITTNWSMRADIAAAFS